MMYPRTELLHKVILREMCLFNKPLTCARLIIEHCFSALNRTNPRREGAKLLIFVDADSVAPRALAAQVRNAVGIWRSVLLC